MVKKITGILFLSLFLCGIALAHSGKPKYHVIIDSDGSIDDMRAITMLLSGNDIRVLAITCSQGSLWPDSVFAKVSGLLSAFHHEGIPVGISEKVNAELPLWAPFAQAVRWENTANGRYSCLKANSIDVLNHAVECYPEKVTLIALGSLETYAGWLEANENAADHIDRIIWYNSQQITQGFNYSVSPESYSYILQSGIPLEVVTNNRDDLGVGQDYLDSLRSIPSIYARQIEYVHAQPQVVEKIREKHLYLWDDLIPLYLTVPILFETETRHQLKVVSVNGQIPPGFVYETISRLLLSSTYANNRVFASFPTDTALYQPAIAGMLNETVRKFGPVEWKAICMTNEIHGHTGIYSIIGAKMGIRAMEFFNVGVNNLEVITFAGNDPPLSCFNDGVQISSGATIGQGLITISDSISTIPSAIFEFNHQKVRMALKPEIAGRMRNEIKYGVENYGLLSDSYWLYIEELAIRYWADFDRQEIFMIEKI